MSRKMGNMLIIAMVVIMVVAIAVGLSFSPVFHRPVEKEPMAVTITGIERIEVRFGGGFFAADRVESMSYIIAETESGEAVMGIIDISTLDKGNKVVIIENTPYNQHEYKWYRFVDYQ